MPANLVSWWPGDTAADDIVGGNNGTPKGSPAPTLAAGKVGNAFSFANGGTGYVEVPDNPNLDLTTEATLTAWVYLNQLPSSAGHTMHIAGKSGYARDLDLQVDVDNKIRFYTGPGGPISVSSNTVVQVGQWYHVVATYKANVEESMYVNGVLENTTPIAYAREANGNPFTIGENLTFTGRYFYGLIDEVELFNRALSPSEIQVNYNAGTAGGCKTWTKLEATAYSVDEGAETATLTVRRTGDTSGLSTVDLATVGTAYVGCNSTSGIATQNCDYIVASKTLNFAAGETSKTFAVLIVDDGYVETSETLNLSLSNATGTSFGNPADAVLTITDNDLTPSGTNPLDDADADFFVREHYYDFMSRVPDPGGLDYWKEAITQCGHEPICLRTQCVAVSNAFYYELEYQQTGSYVFRLYRAAFGDNQPFPNPNPDPTYPGENLKVPSYAVFVYDRARVIAGSNLTQAQLDLANRFVSRPEFTNKYSASLPLDQFVDAILLTLINDIGVDLSAQRSALIALGSRGAVLYRLADDNLLTNPINNRPFIDAEYNRAFVTTQYFGYLRRNADVGGLLFWLGQVNRFPIRDGNAQHAMVCSFITSAEYQRRFSPLVTHSNAECPQ